MNTAPTNRSAFLATSPIFPLLLKMSIPATVGMLVNALYNVVDTIFVGQGVGPIAIGALAIAFPIQMLVSAIAMALSSGASSIVSRRLGEHRDEDAARTIGTVLLAAPVGTALLTALLFCFMDPVLVFFGATQAILPLAREYLGIVGLGFVFFGFSMAASNLVRAEGLAKESMVGMLLGAALNCVLDPLFIFGFGWGVAGAAWATVLSQLASTSWLVAIYLRRKNHIKLHRKHFTLDFHLLGESALLGIPAFVHAAGMSVISIVVYRSLGVYGGDQAISIYGTVFRIISLIIMPLLGIVQGFQPIAGYNFGAKRFDRVRKVLLTTNLTAFGVAAFIYVPLMLFPSAAIGLFTSDAGFKAAGANVLRTMICMVPLVALQIVNSNYFLAVGKAAYANLLGLSRQFLFLVPLLLLLPTWLGLDGIWWSYPAADLLSVLVTMTFLVRELRHLDARHAEGAEVRHDAAR